MNIAQKTNNRDIQGLKRTQKGWSVLPATLKQAYFQWIVTLLPEKVAK